MKQSAQSLNEIGWKILVQNIKLRALLGVFG
jgi:hypothetical protein